MERTFESDLAALPQPADDREVLSLVAQLRTLEERVETAVVEAAAADRVQHEAERQLGVAAAGRDDRHLAAAQDRLDAAIARRQQLVVRARALTAAAAETERSLAAARVAAIGRCRVAWDERGAQIKAAHDAALAAFEQRQTEVARFGRALAEMTRTARPVVVVRFTEGTSPYARGDTAGFPAGEAAVFVRDGRADYVDAWRSQLAALADPSFESRRAAARAERSRPVSAAAHLSGRGFTPSAVPDAGPLDPSGLT
jgi:hypothetical protein